MHAKPVTSAADISRIRATRRTRAGLFSSFEAMLNVLAEMVRSDVILQVERGCRPTPEQRALVARVRAMDPSGFGAVVLRALCWRRLGRVSSLITTLGEESRFD